MSIHVAGRGPRQWVCKLTPMKGALVLRLEDCEDDVFWLEICLSETELLRQLAAVHRLTHTPDTVTEFTAADDVARLFGLEPVDSGATVANPWPRPPGSVPRPKPEGHT